MDVISENFDAKINHLCIELLVRIFLLTEKQTAQGGNWYPHFRLSWVCRHWRDIINGSAVFWTVIDFPRWKGREFMQTLVTRSGTAQLSVLSPLQNRQFTTNIRAFNNLLESEGHRIKHLDLSPSIGCDLELLSGKKILPALTIFIFPHGDPLITIEIIKSSKRLRYLDTLISSALVVSELQLSSHCLQGLNVLNVEFVSVTIAEQFLACLSLCSNLRSLSMCMKMGGDVSAFDFPSAITLPKLAFLRTEHYEFIDQLRAPALKTALIDEPIKRSRTNHSFFDDYDLSSIRHLAIRGDSRPGTHASIWIQGSTSLLRSQHLLGPMTPYSPDVDLREGVSPPFISSSEPIHASFLVPNHHPNPLITKILSKMPNLEVLSISPNRFRSTLPFHTTSSSYEAIIKGILNHLTISSNLKRLIITDNNCDFRLLNVVIQVLNAHSLLSNLDVITFRITSSSDFDFKYDSAGLDFGKEIVNLLQLQRAAGRDALQFELEGAKSLPKEWVNRAVRLGAQIRPLSDKRKYDI